MYSIKIMETVNVMLMHHLITIIPVNPPVTARVKFSQNVDILTKVYLVHCQTLRVVSTFTGQN